MQIEHVIHGESPPYPYMGKLKYDLAYIAFLMNAPARAQRLLHESAFHERIAGNNMAAKMSEALALFLSMKSSSRHWDVFTEYINSIRLRGVALFLSR